MDDARALFEFIRSVVDEEDGAAAAVLSAERDFARDSIHAAAAIAELNAVETHLEDDPGAVREPGGPFGWTPLLYLCLARHRAGRTDNARQRVSVARRLIAAGADVNDGAKESETVRGYRTALGGAVGRARSSELVRVLLEAGADPADGPTLYEGSAIWEAVRHRDLESLEHLVAAQPPQWLLCHALPHCLGDDDLVWVGLLLKAGADPTWPMGPWGFGGGSLHEAIALGCSKDVVGALFEAGGGNALDRDRRTPLQAAHRFAHAGAIEALRFLGPDETVTDVDRWVGACWSGDGTIPETDASRLTRTDHQMVPRAVRLGRPGSAVRLLRGGADPNVPDDDGETALHLAAAGGDVALCEALLEAGADINALNYAGLTPLDVSDEIADTHSRERVVACLATNETAAHGKLRHDDPRFATTFERAADAVVAGDIDAVRQALDATPGLATARSARPHRATLLHYLGANGVEGWRQRTPPNAVAMTNLLIERGSDPNALCYTYRGGPDQTTLGLLTSSGHPVAAGLMLPIVNALARGGATLDGAYRVLNDLYEARQRGESPTLADPAASEGALREAAGLNERDLVEWLLDAGVDVNAADATGVTALHTAAINGRTDIADLLLVRGADAALRESTYDGTPAGWADAGGHPDLAEKLRG